MQRYHITTGHDREQAKEKATITSYAQVNTN